MHTGRVTVATAMASSWPTHDQSLAERAGEDVEDERPPCMPHRANWTTLKTSFSPRWRR